MPQEKRRGGKNGLPRLLYEAKEKSEETTSWYCLVPGRRHRVLEKKGGRAFSRSSLKTVRGKKAQKKSETAMGVAA